MASTAEILHCLLSRPPSAPHAIAYNYLVPNQKGLIHLIETIDKSTYPTPPVTPDEEQAPETSANDSGGTTSEDPVAPSSMNTTEISLFAAATETFSQKNTNCSVADSLERCKPIMALAKSRNIRVRGYVSVALGCPYEGPDVDPHKVAEITTSLLEMGCDEVSVADTTGMGTAPKTRKLLQTLKGAGIRNEEDIALHFHDTFGMALVNLIVGLEAGIRTFDSSVGGLGGCPYSKGATGNVATEDVVHLLHSLGVQTGVNIERMADIGSWITGELSRANDSRAGKATLARRQL